jgi:N-acyl-D-amino-acid deacylase
MDPGRPVAEAVAIADGRILAVGSDEEIGEFVRPGLTVVHDVAGHVVSPGFVDIHTHLEYGSPEATAVYARQGVTTAVTGNCGVSSADVAVYLEAIDAAGAYCDVATLVGSVTLRVSAGVGDRRATASNTQLKRIQAAAGAALQLGAVGISLGPDYAPGTDVAEQSALAEVAAAERCTLTSHVHVHRAERPDPLAAVEEFLVAGRAAGAALEISHIASIAGSTIDDVITLVEGARSQGVDVTADCYPYEAWSTLIKSALFDGEWTSRLDVDYGDVEVVGGPYDGVRLDPELFAELREAREDTVVIGHAIPWHAVAEALRRPWCMVASDGAPTDFGGVDLGHPRQAGTFPRVLARLVRQDGVLGLAEALLKMTALPAWRLQLPGKGRLAPGFDADLVVFDPGAVNDRADYSTDKCGLPPEGIALVFVRGQLCVSGAGCLDTRPGRALRRAHAGSAVPVINHYPTLEEILP